MRISSNAFREWRRERKSTIFVTGGTGFLGSHLTVALLQKGHGVILLARPSRHVPVRERIEQLLAWFGVEEGDRSRLQVVEGALDRERLGLDASRYNQVLENVDEILHCASCTSFSEKNRAEVEAANIGGLSPILEIASQGRCFFLHHISTAYVAGKKTGICPEAFVDSRDFTNIYEETKYLGERILAAACQREGIRLNIYRPSVVYGDSRTGRSLRFNALYYPVKTALFFKDIYAKDIRENGGKRAAALGARTESDGALYLPLRIEAAGQGGINLIPIDFFVKALLALMEEGLEGEIFHIVNSKITAVEEIIAYAQRLFQMRGIRTAPREAFDCISPNSLEILFNSYMEIYRPYLRDGRIFDNQKTEAILRSRGLSCPELDYEIFSHCMEYAVDVDWGTRLFKKSSRSRRQDLG